MINNNIGQSYHRLAFDVSGFSQLKQQAVNGSPESIRQVAQQFETLFINMMMQSMRKAVPEGGLFSSSASQLFTSMFDQQIAQEAAGKGFGLADMLTKQLSRTSMSTEPAKSNTDVNQTQVAQSSMTNSLAQSLFTDSVTHTPKALGQVLYQNPVNNSAIQAKVLNPTASQQKSDSKEDHITQFVNQWLNPAQLAAKQTGIPYQIIIAQAALETGWGKRQITTTDGQPSYNYFAIKAGNTWQGKTTEITTTEYVNNKKVTKKHRFRVYDNHHQAINDYTRLITQNPRYKVISQAPTAKAAAQALQQANYATDPNYGSKLIQLIDQIDSITKSISIKNVKGFNRISF